MATGSLKGIRRASLHHWNISLSFLTTSSKTTHFLLGGRIGLERKYCTPARSHSATHLSGGGAHHCYSRSNAPLRRIRRADLRLLARCVFHVYPMVNNFRAFQRSEER